ncbi:MAG: protein translocase subunit SecF [Sulfurospirillaceae bacterium]|jgi:preprotein translocase subunit SecF|nr:protein translocase subunit SecF [Sulfurospirillaceae bacterium]MDD2827618.1 protein translocase subunit SecF [Sulfurospirillaceae bacterium]
MEIFSKSKIYDFMSQSKHLITASIILILVSYVLLFTKGLSYGIDFSGGTLVQVKYDTKAPIEKIREQISQDELFANAQITEFGSPDEIVIRFATATDSVGQDLGDKIRTLLVGTGNFDIRKVDIVGPKVGGELRAKGLASTILCIIGILMYIAFRFEWRFAVASIIALVHDVSITLGAIILFDIDMSLDVLAAILTLIGYSINDTIIVFDRIREEVKNTKNFDLFDVINLSVSKTLSRTTLTSLTVLLVVLTLFLFGGEIIHGFSFTLLFGVIIGTYSSIFVAAPLLKWFGFDIESYKNKQALKEKNRIEKEKMRSQYEKGTV